MNGSSPCEGVYVSKKDVCGSQREEMTRAGRGDTRRLPRALLAAVGPTMELVNGAESGIAGRETERDRRCCRNSKPRQKNIPRKQRCKRGSWVHGKESLFCSRG